MTRKSIVTVLILTVFSLTMSAAPDVKDILQGLSGKSSSKSSSKTDKVESIINAVSSVVGSGKVSFKDLTGSWQYADPAVTFQSDNLLKKAGGAAASSAITKKLAPYYKTAGITSMTITFGADSTFNAKIGKIPVSGKVSDLGNGKYAFSLKKLDKIPAATIQAYIEKKGTNVAITFDAKKLLSIVKKVASVSGNSTLESIGSLAGSYEGLNIGVELKKSASTK